MSGTATGYCGVMLVSDDPLSPGRYSSPSRCSDLVALLRSQHHELRLQMARIPQLQGPARQDVFLQLRRRLAVHEALERCLLAPRVVGTAEEQLDIHPDVRAVEGCDPDSREFDAAYARMAVTHLHHARVQEDEVFDRLDGDLTGAERAVLAAAVRLWAGEGERCLGSSYVAMVAAAHEELDEAAAEWTADGRLSGPAWAR